MQFMKCSRLLAPAMCALLASTVTFAQNPASFNIVTSNAAPYNPGNIYSVDVNNDGLTDIIQDGGYSPSAFFVSTNNGNGTFAAPVEYTLPVSTGEPTCIAAADFNNDGKIDLAVPLIGTSEIAVYLNNGNGTFKSPIVTTVNLPSGTTFATAGCAAADFNGDGNKDFAAWTTAWTDGGMESSTELYVFQGEGNGSFSASSAYPVLAGPSFPYGMQVFVGDYDGDGKADIAASAPAYSGDTSTVYVLYGNNDFSFESTTPYVYSGLLWIGSGDLNSDGITDLYMLTNYSPAPQQVGVFYGDKSRTFASYWIDTPAGYYVGSGTAAWTWMSGLTMADYNGDGRMDLVASAVSSSSNAQSEVVFLAGTNPGEFTSQVVALPAQSPWITSPVAGLLSGGYLKPDAVLNQSNTGSNDTTPTTLPALLNTTEGLFGICPYPKSGKGFDVCAAGLSKGEIAAFSAAVDSFGKLRTMELFVDGSKVATQDHTWDTHAYFDWAGKFSTGTHKGTFYAYDVDNSVQRYDFTFDVK
ncbi:MAG: VCBS repeat-containing protein [Terracidiphilus sp.]|jgi:hypothetical protein